MEKELLDVTKRSGIFFFGGIIGSCINLAFTLIVTHYIGAQEYGQFIYVYTLVGFFPLLCTLGLEKGLVYFIPKMTVSNRIEERDTLICFCFGLTFIVSIALTGIIIAGNTLIADVLLRRGNLAVALTLTVPLIIFLTFNEMANAIYRSIGNIATSVRIQNIIVPVVQILAISLFVVLGYSLLGIIGAFYIGMACGSLLLLRDMIKLGIFSKFSFKNLRPYRDIFLYSFPLLMSGLIAFLGRRADILILGHSSSLNTVAVYQIAFQIGTMTNFALAAFTAIFGSVITALFYKNELGTLENLYKTITKWIVASNVICFSIILLFSQDILRIFGEEFVVGSTALIVISIGQLFNVGVGPAGLINTMTGHPHYAFYISIGMTVMNIALALWLIPLYGITGAAVASFATVGASNIVRLVLVYRDLKIHPYDWSYSKIIIAAIVSYLVMYAIKNIVDMNWFFKLFVLSSFYVLIFGSITVIMGLSANDMIIVKKFRDKLKFNN